MSRILYELRNEADQRFSPYCWRVIAAAALKGISFERRGLRYSEIPKVLGGGQSMVPILVEGDRVVNDSFAIAEYLDGCEGEHDRKLFETESAKAHARFVEYFVNTLVNPLIMRQVGLIVMKGITREEQVRFREIREKRYGATLEEFCADPHIHKENLGKLLAGLSVVFGLYPFIGGTSPNYSDCILYGSLQWARQLDVDAGALQNVAIAAWQDRLDQLVKPVPR